MNLSSNRINQNTPRSHRSIPSHAPAQRPQVQQANTLSNYGTTTRVKSLYPGQILKGEVSDLRNNEIVVTLENNTTVAGHLDNGNWLSIGEIAAFKVLSVSQENIVLQPMPRADMALAGSTIQKALEEAGIPRTKRNQEIVLELMKNQLPIHKQSILQMLQHSYQNKDISIPTLVTMYKHNIPISTENATQLEHYQNNRHALSQNLETLSRDLTSLIKELAESIHSTINAEDNEIISYREIMHQQSEHISEQSQIIEKHTSNTTVTGTNIFQTTVAKILSCVLDKQSGGNQISRTINNEQTISLPNETQRQELVSIFENFQISDESNIKEEILNNNASLRTVIKIIDECYKQVSNKNIENPENDKTDSSSKAKLLEHPVITALKEQFHQLQTQNKELGSQLDILQREELAEYLKDFPLDETIKNKTLTGEINRGDLLRTIKNVLPFTREDAASQLLSSNVFSSLVEEEFLDQLFLSPKEIFSYGGVDKYYTELTKQLTELDTLFQRNEDTKEQTTIHQLINSLSTPPKESVVELRNNLDFMKVLNQFFSYVQLPTKLQEKCTHADLYVYTKKKNLMKQQNPLQVLLHLNMDNLGALDVHITLNNRHVATKFHLENEKIGKLIGNNFHVLEQNLGEHGYTCSNEIVQSEKKIDIVQDFISKENINSSISRYSFDLRA